MLMFFIVLSNKQKTWFPNQAVLDLMSKKKITNHGTRQQEQFVRICDRKYLLPRFLREDGNSINCFVPSSNKWS